jgi:hypothetical protein
MFPKTHLKEQKCILYDILGNWEEVILYFMKSKSDKVEAYVVSKKNPQVTNVYLEKLTKPPLDPFRN